MVSRRDGVTTPALRRKEKESWSESAMGFSPTVEPGATDSTPKNPELELLVHLPSAQTTAGKHVITSSEMATLWNLRAGEKLSSRPRIQDP